MRPLSHTLLLSFFAALLFSNSAIAGTAEADRLFRFIMRILERDDLNRAIPELRRFVKKFPDDPRHAEVEFRLAYTLHKAGKSSEAENILCEWLTRHRDHDLAGKALFWRGEALSSVGKDDEARTLWRQVLSRFPNGERAPNALDALGWSHFRAGRWHEALDSFRRLKSKFPGNTTLAEGAARLAAECLLRMGRAKEALNEFDLVLASASDGTVALEARFGRASALQALNRAEDAAKELYAVVDQSQRTGRARDLLPEALLSLSSSLIAAGRSAEALKAVQKLEALPNGGLAAKRAGLRKGIALEALGKMSEAEEAYEAVLAMPEAASVHGQTAWRLGELRYRKGDRFGAISLYDKVVSLGQPEHLIEDALYNSAVTLGEAGRNEDALERLDKLLTSRRSSELADDALYAAGELLIRLDKLEQAAERYGEYLRRFPGGELAPDARFRRGWCLNAVGKADAARAEFEAVLRGEPQGERAAEAAFMLGEGARERNKSGEAARFYEQSRAAAPGSTWAAESLWALATMARDDGDDDEARRLVGVLINGIPESRLIPWALRLGGDLDLAAGRIEAGLGCFQTLIRRFPKHELIPAALAGQAWAFLKSNKRSQALKGFQAVAASFPDTRYGAEALYHAAVILREDGKTDEAARTVDELLRRHPEGHFAEDALLQRALGLRDGGDDQGALKQLRALRARFPKSNVVPEALREEALIHYALKDRVAEREAWQAVADGFAEHPVAFDAHWGLGAIAQEDGNFDAAVRHYTKAVEAGAGRKEAAAASLHLATCLLRAKRPADAQRAFRRTYQDYPGTPEGAQALVKAGTLALEAGQVEEAVELLKAAEGVDAAMPALGRALRESGRAAEAKKLLQSRLDGGGLETELARTMRLELGRTLVQLGESREGERLLNDLFRDSNDETAAEALFALAGALEKRGAMKDADRAFYELLLLYPFKRFHAEARYRIGQINEKLGDYPRAREFYAELVRENPKHPLAKKARERLDIIGP